MAGIKYDAGVAEAAALATVAGAMMNTDEFVTRN
jgi:hypothetical protein